MKAWKCVLGAALLVGGVSGADAQKMPGFWIGVVKEPIVVRNVSRGLKPLTGPVSRGVAGEWLPVRYDRMVGAESLKTFSLIGKGDYAVRAKAGKLVASMPLSRMLAKKIESLGLTEPAFPGYYTNFEADLKRFFETHKEYAKAIESPGVTEPNFLSSYMKSESDLKKLYQSRRESALAFELARSLDQMFAEGTAFAGTMAVNMNDLARFSQTGSWSHSGEAFEAVLNALAMGKTIKSGFVVVVAGHVERGAKDVLLLDLPNKQWISLNQSKAKEVAARYQKEKQYFRDHNPVLAERLDRQGFVAELPAYTGEFAYTLDGVTWFQTDNRELQEAFRRGFYVKFKYGGREVEGFSYRKGQPLVRTIAEVK